MITKAFSFILPTDIRYGKDITSDLTILLKDREINQVLLVTDPGILKTTLVDQVVAYIKTAGAQVTIFSDVSPNPRDTEVTKGASIGIHANAEAIVAVGGGSPMDCAKSINVLMSLKKDSIKEFEGSGKVPRPLKPYFAIPTTAGTGSEVTWSSVINDTENQYKMTIKSTYMAATVALVDPALTTSVPAAITASTGMDALTHAIEAFTAKNANPISDALALQSVELITQSLLNAYRHGDDMQARDQMMMGSMLGGLAFSHSDVASVHCMAEALGGSLDLPHGLCNSILLPYVMEFNAPAAITRFARLAKAMGLTFDEENEGADLAVQFVKDLASSVELPQLNELAVTPEDFPRMAAIAMKNGSTPSNAREMTEIDYLNLFQRAYQG